MKIRSTLRVSALAAVTALILCACSSAPVAAPAAAAPAPAKTVATEQGKTVFNQNCAMCHIPGLAESPKLGDKAAWGPRIAQGKEALLKSALGGKGVMPAKGGNPKLTEDELKAAIDFMVASVE
jgi:cytochrome c5